MPQKVGKEKKTLIYTKKSKLNHAGNRKRHQGSKVEKGDPPIISFPVNTSFLSLNLKMKILTNLVTYCTKSFKYIFEKH